MITLVIFYLHTVAAVAAFTTRWQESDLKEGLLAVGFILLIFVVGWSITTVLVRPLIGAEGFGPWLDRDTLALLLLTVLEAVFYTLQIRGRRRKATRPA